MYKEAYITIPAVNYVRKDFYLLDSLNEKMKFLEAAGFINFWHFQDVDNGILKRKDPRQPKVLDLTRLAGCFLILIVGWAISIIAVVIELFRANYKSIYLFVYYLSGLS